MRFSRRQRGMEIDQDLAADEELDLQVERAAQQRCCHTSTCLHQHSYQLFSGPKQWKYLEMYDLQSYQSVICINAKLPCWT